MTQYLKKSGRGFAFLIALVVATGIGFYCYPYLISRICWGDKSWTSNEDFVAALFKVKHPEIFADLVVEREDSGLFRAEGGGALIRATPPKLNYPRFQLRGDRYSGLIAMEVPTQTGLGIYFFDSCGNFMGEIQ
ncbi:hypothetical protein JMK10_02200 [Rhodovulum sulfidophilum]|uniref:hypothetical protein n=1 Tax=Rhodovulum sulfidophilum TaxID=35806 RepID=UPI0019225BBC|nr:hypothetical protein [Rhodovulum sulfidophilum]MBL3574290.1 hypothetical protein [Rhodovulum sulfidophilum]MCF4115655.1 hypothetical protein [Rhodovulum sulfidophilum]